MQILWPVALAGGVALVAVLARQHTPSRTVLVVAMLGCILVYEAQTTAGRRAWAWRTYDLMFDVQAARHVAPQAAPYRQLLARVPRGQRVAVWVTQPELLDYARHAIIDLRTPRAAKSGKLDRLLAATRADWLVVEGHGDPRLEKLLATRAPVASTRGIHLFLLDAPR
jgi:hypothetical protein